MTSKEIQVHLSANYGIDDDNILADIMGIIDSNIGSFLNNVDIEEVPDYVKDYEY